MLIYANDGTRNCKESYLPYLIIQFYFTYCDHHVSSPNMRQLLYDPGEHNGPFVTLKFIGQNTETPFMTLRT